MASDPRDIKTEDARQSLNQTMEDVYAKIPAGGAFDAKTIETSGKRESLSKSGNSSFQSAHWTPAGFKTRMGLLMTEFKDSTLNFIKTKGHSTRRYK
jgi:hypothetical protein